MYNEVIPGSYLCKLADGVAYYLVSVGVVGQLAKTGDHYQNGASTSFTKVALKHLLSGATFHAQFYKINLLNWEQLPLNYQQDAVASNEDIRRKYYEVLYPAQNKRMSEHLKKSLFTAIDKATGELKFFSIKKDLQTAIGPVYELQGAGTSQATREAVKSAFGSATRSAGAVFDPNRNLGLGPFDEDYVSSPAEDAALKERIYGSNSQTVQIGMSNGTKAFYFGGENKDSNNNTNNSSMNLGNIPGLNLNFGLLEKGRIAISINGDLAFRDKNGQYVTIEEEGTQKTRVEVGDMKLDVDFYKLPTQDLDLGDVILLDNELLIVSEKKTGDTVFVNPLTGAKTTKLQRSNILGMYFYTKVVSLFDMAGGGGGGKGLGLNGLDPMTLMLLSGQGGANGLAGGDLSQMLVLSQLTKGGNEMNPMLLMALSGGQNGGIGGGNMMQTMLMMQALGNKGGGLFGNRKIAAKPVVAKPAARKKAIPKKTTNRTSVKG